MRRRGSGNKTEEESRWMSIRRRKGKGEKKQQNKTKEAAYTVSYLNIRRHFKILSSS